MVLVVYYLLNHHHASDGWAFGGVLVRQAYAMGLNRDPSTIVPFATEQEKQERRKLWQAVLIQDTFLSVLLKLPPAATHADVNMDNLLTETPANPLLGDPGDSAYIHCMWILAHLVQENICSPRSLDLPISSTSRHKSQLISSFRAAYRTFPDVFRSWDEDVMAELAKRNKRLLRQIMFLTSNYFHSLMLVQVEDSEDVPLNLRGALEAAHEAIRAFFVLHTHVPTEANVWWVFQHRSFSEAVSRFLPFLHKIHVSYSLL